MLNLEKVQEILKNNNLTLREHQIEGIKTILQWYYQGHGGILADEMGLGKTCQAIVSVLLLMEKTKKHPCLVICPLSVLDHWLNEISRFSCGKLKPICYYESKINRPEMRNNLKKSDWNLLLTTYEIFLNDYKLLNFEWEFVVFDESQRVKSIDSLLSNAIRESSINWMISITGTPVQNNLFELYSILSYADKKKFPLDGAKDFVKRYKDFNNENITKEFHELFKNYCLRRDKTILHDIPPCQEITLYHGMTKLQKDLYKSILGHDRDFFLNQTNSKSNSKQSLMFILAQLRKAVCHPYLFNGFEKEPYIEGDHLRDFSGKLLILDRLLKYLFEKKHKVLIFSQFTRFLNIIYDYLIYKDYVVEQLDGSTKQQTRKTIISNFQRDDSDVFVFLLSTRSGGIGLNLTAADTVIFLDSDLNPQADKQAAARCHRIGQKKPVKIIRLVASHTVDEIILSRSFRKLLLSQQVIETKDDVIHSTVNLNDLILKNFKVLEQEDVATPLTVQVITDNDLEAIIGITKDCQWDINNINNEQNDIDIPIIDEYMNSKALYKFEGHDYTEDRLILEKIANNAACGIELRFDDDIKNFAKMQIQFSSKKILRSPHRKLNENELLEKIEEQKKRLEEKKLLAIELKKKLWDEKNYVSLNLPAVDVLNVQTSKDSSKLGQIYSISGDVTKPVIFKKGKNNLAIILFCVGLKKNFETNSVYITLQKINPNFNELHLKAKKMQDFKMSDCHLIPLITDDSNLTETKKTNQQDLNFGKNFKNESIDDQDSKDVSYNTSKVFYDQKNIQNILKMSVALSVCIDTKNNIKLANFERALCRIGKYAAENNASIHMTQVWYNRGVSKSKICSLVQKSLCQQFGVDVYIYHYNKNANNLTNNSRDFEAGDANDSNCTNENNSKVYYCKKEDDYDLSSETNQSSDSLDENSNNQNLSSKENNILANTTKHNKQNEEKPFFASLRSSSKRLSTNNNYNNHLIFKRVKVGKK